MTDIPGWFVRNACSGLLLGGVSLALLSGCGDPAPVTAEKSKFQVAGDDEKQPAKDGSQGDAKGTEKLPRSEGDPLIPKLSPRPRGESDPEGAAKTDEPTEVATVDTTDYGASPQYPLPPGGAQDVADFLRNLGEKKPKGRTKQEQEADYLAIQESRLAAARKLLTFRIPKEAKFGILQLMMEIHQGFIENKVPEAEQRLEAFAQELSGHKDPEVAELGRVQAFDIAINKLAKQDPPPADGKEVAAEIEKFVEAAKGSPIGFMVAGRKCMELQAIDGATKQFQLDLVEELKKVATRYGESSVPQIAAQAKQVLEMAGIFEAEIEIKPLLKDTAEGKEGAEEKFLAAIKELLAKEKPTATLFKIVSDKATELEYGHGKVAAALSLYEMLETTFKDHADEKLVEHISKSAESARKRIGLIGKPLVVEGVTPDGKPFDLSPYKGKYVLVDFWATWCGPCLQELPNVRKNYNAYHAKGFDVIGLSLDDSLEDLKDFLELQGPPWQTVISQELFEKKRVANGMGMSANPIAVANGVQAIPFVVLLDKEGNVDSLHLRGPRLEARLKELLGEPAETPAIEEGTEKPKEEKPATEKSEKAEEKADEKAAEKADEKKPAAKPEDPKQEEGGGCGAAVEEEKKEAAEDENKVNPYSARPGLSSEKLVAYIEKMLDKPKSIQARPGFTEAVVEACDRVLTAIPAVKETEILTAAEAKFETLHKKACTGDDACDKALVAFMEQMKADARPRVARQVAFFQQERKVLDGAELPADKIPGLLKELKDYYAAEKLTSKHLRMASSTVALINKLDSGDEREKLFAEFGGLFAKAGDKELARYGKKLAQKPEAEASDLVGKELELDGTTAAGNPFKWGDYRGKVVLVDFWATWCGPCRKEMPHVKELYEKHSAQGFTVVGVSLDKDQEALAAYLAENQIPWENLAGDETKDLAQKYGVRGIPTMMAVGKDGKILGVSHNVGSLIPLIEKALAVK
ncbi:MAG: TlpA family protein disulfide reductase [Pirellulaceae bacterium]